MNYLRFIRIIGTMHVSPQSVEDVRKAILELKPNAVAVELDPDRYLSLISGKKMGIFDVRSGGEILGYLLAKVEEKAGEIFGTPPGKEMLTAIETARKLGIPVYFVDEHISMTMERILQEIPPREKFLLTADLVFSLLGFGYEIDFSSAIHEFKTKYPVLYRVLVEDRNKVIAKNLVKVVENLRSIGIKKPLLLAVLGWGHEKGVERILNSWPSLRL